MAGTMRRALVPVADGTEEIEAVTIIDVLRRAGVEVTVASAMPALKVTASRGVVIEADCLLDECGNGPWDLVALPGGMPGAEHLAGSELLMGIVREQLAGDRWLGAICAAPVVVLGRHGLLGDRRATCHSGFRNELRGLAAAVSDDVVVRDGNLVTSQAPGTAMAFALELVSCLLGGDKRRAVAGPMAAT
ncbi:DJ-1 family glyoxalase III [Microbulbifer yueqingensis]|uniref:4-methyl-5(B-hydroxyethyl)-thiazole monophosphate biosynthesis n=1 Tax=Microbulbifer yueqingensis TaxID=658219 RepID=A0A1G9DE30_9GAMM|nr:DJ-1 family glyoxalase III [Microbulbifer yueqingensis]SDK62123.1 4-methyl-5(b-hydroxyethyl)-thiazole monophosphate biosynthesis [Microbulbifer yueqingensis]